MQGGAGEAGLPLSPSQLCVANRRGAENCNPSAAGYYCRCVVERPSSRHKSLPSQSPNRQPMPAHCKVALSWHKADIPMPHVNGSMMCSAAQARGWDNSRHQCSSPACSPCAELHESHCADVHCMVTLLLLCAARLRKQGQRLPTAQQPGLLALRRAPWKPSPRCVSRMRSCTTSLLLTWYRRCFLSKRPGFPEEPSECPAFVQTE